jgi:hypothetical protein
VSAYENVPLCRSCYLAWLLGNGLAPREPVVGINVTPEPCLICAIPTTISTRESGPLVELYRALSSQ